MNTVSVEQLAAELSQVLEAVMSGHEIVITSEGSPIAKIVSTKPLIRGGFGGAADCIEVRDDFDEPLPDFEPYMPPDDRRK